MEVRCKKALKHVRNGGVCFLGFFFKYTVPCLEAGLSASGVKSLWTGTSVRRMTESNMNSSQGSQRS